MFIDKMTDTEIAPCLASGPLAESGLEFTKTARELGSHPFASILRAWCVPVLFERLERLLLSGQDPIEGVTETMRGLAKLLSRADQVGLGLIKANGIPSDGKNFDSLKDNVKELTGDHYGRLFKEFSSRSYWEEPVNLLEQRLVRNGIPLSSVQDKYVLDAGCGGGRYSAAWRLLGAKPIVGVDISPVNIEDATHRAEMAELTGLIFQQGDVLNLPFNEAEFDIIFSNGVLHHTTDWEKGVSELMRVLKPGGWGWLYLIEDPGGVFWDVIEILRVVMKGESRETSRSALQQLNMPANRIFYMLDHVMVPINLRLRPNEVEDCLSSCGAIEFRRLDRGADIDRVEQIFRGEQFAAERFGVGENRYVFSKP